MTFFHQLSIGSLFVILGVNAETLILVKRSKLLARTFSLVSAEGRFILGDLRIVASHVSVEQIDRSHIS